MRVTDAAPQGSYCRHLLAWWRLCPSQTSQTRRHQRWVPKRALLTSICSRTPRQRGPFGEPVNDVPMVWSMVTLNSRDRGLFHPDDPPSQDPLQGRVFCCAWAVQVSTSAHGTWHMDLSLVLRSVLALLVDSPPYYPHPRSPFIPKPHVPSFHTPRRANRFPRRGRRGPLLGFVHLMPPWAPLSHSFYPTPGRRPR